MIFTSEKLSSGKSYNLVTTYIYRVFVHLGVLKVYRVPEVLPVLQVSLELRENQA